MVYPLIEQMEQTDEAASCQDRHPLHVDVLDDLTTSNFPSPSPPTSKPSIRLSSILMPNDGKGLSWRLQDEKKASSLLRSCYSEALDIPLPRVNKDHIVLHGVGGLKAACVAAVGFASIGQKRISVWNKE